MPHGGFCCAYFAVEWVSYWIPSLNFLNDGLLPVSWNKPYTALVSFGDGVVLATKTKIEHLAMPISIKKIKLQVQKNFFKNEIPRSWNVADTSHQILRDK